MLTRALSALVYSCLLLTAHSATKSATAKSANKYWTHNGNKIRYLSETSLFNQAPAVLLVHGFGGNADQFRKNIPVLKESGNVYSIDLLGYGYSDKPSPREYGVNELYNFETWGAQLSAFIEEVIKRPTIIVANSVGGVAALQSAVTNPKLVKGVVLINLSMRMLHIKKQNFIQKPLVNAIQTVLRETDIGKTFFKSVAKPATIRNILNQAYGYEGTKDSVDDEIIRTILEPGLQPGAAEVFLDFISYR
jgi:pimeloyl-ACP methyl ester carboxylesterase